MAQELYKKIYSVQEFYWILYQGLRTMKYMSRAQKSKELSMKFIERIMLAVTEVNGCDICSYVHTKIALEQGMTNEEIQMILSGTTDEIPENEGLAIIFAQHFADTRGNPSRDAWQRIIEVYGPSKAKGILGAIRAMMVGNAYGIAWSALRSRMKGKPVKKTGLLYELTILFSILILLPAALIHALLSDLLEKPIISF